LSGGTPQAYSWAKAHDLCVPVGANLCQAACLPPGSYLGCIAQAGDLACPTGFAKKALSYSGASDSRTCSSCGCSIPSGGSCASTALLYPCSSCTSGATGPLTVSIGACATADQYIRCAGQSIRSARYAGATPNSGQCTPSGGLKSGSVTPTGPVTICCP
jgi:hypothetical protein